MDELMAFRPRFAVAVTLFAAAIATFGFVSLPKNLDEYDLIVDEGKK